MGYSSGMVGSTTGMLGETVGMISPPEPPREGRSGMGMRMVQADKVSEIANIMMAKTRFMGITSFLLIVYIIQAFSLKDKGLLQNEGFTADSFCIAMVEKHPGSVSRDVR
jgi:hypothetical protein